MKILTNSLLLAALAIAGNANAADVKTAGQAVTLCKAQAQSAHPGYKRSISKKIRQGRAGFKVNMKVITDDGSVKAVCEVTKDGTVSYSKA